MKIKPGLVVTLLICAMMIVFRHHFLALVWMAETTIVGNPICSTPQARKGLWDLAHFLRLKDQYADDRKHQFTRVEQDGRGFDRWRTPDADYWIPRGSDGVLRDLIAQQVSNIYGTDTDGVQPGDVVLDCGAHVGVFTRNALRLRASKVIAIEPGPENVECFRRNFSKEISDGRVILLSEGVWNEETVLTLHTFPQNSAADNFIAGDFAGQSNSVPVKVTTIDKITSDLRLPKVDFIKMDIKGSTARALMGARETLAQFAPRLAISTEETSLDDVTEIMKACPQYVTKCGFCTGETGVVRPAVIFLRKKGA